MFFCKSLDFLAIDWGNIYGDPLESILSTWSKHKVYSPEPSARDTVERRIDKWIVWLPDYWAFSNTDVIRNILIPVF